MPINPENQKSIAQYMLNDVDICAQYFDHYGRMSYSSDLIFDYLQNFAHLAHFAEYGDQNKYQFVLGKAPLYLFSLLYDQDFPTHCKEKLYEHAVFHRLSYTLGDITGELAVTTKQIAFGAFQSYPAQDARIAKTIEDLNHPSPDGITALHAFVVRICNQGNDLTYDFTQPLAALVNSGCNLNEPMPYGNQGENITPLEMALVSRAYPLLKALLEKGAKWRLQPNTEALIALEDAQETRELIGLIENTQYESYSERLIHRLEQCKRELGVDQEYHFIVPKLSFNPDTPLCNGEAQDQKTVFIIPWRIEGRWVSMVILLEGSQLQSAVYLDSLEEQREIPAAIQAWFTSAFPDDRPLSKVKHFFHTDDRDSGVLAIENSIAAIEYLSQYERAENEESRTAAVDRFIETKKVTRETVRELGEHPMEDIGDVHFSRTDHPPGEGQAADANNRNRLHAHPPGATTTTTSSTAATSAAVGSSP